LLELDKGRRDAMKFSDEIVMAYVDGEIDAAQRAAVEQALSSDPQLAERIAHQRRLRTRLTTAFAGVLEEPVPERLTDRAQHAPVGGTVLAGSPRWLGAARRRTQQWSWPEWGALAATLIAGVLISRAWLTAPSPLLVSMGAEGFAMARGELAVRLSQSAGGTRDRASGVEVGLSYLAKSGSYCRTFAVPSIPVRESSTAMAGIACRAGAQWRIQALLPTAGEARSDYRQAGSALPPALLSIIESDSAADPLDAEEEAAVRARGWQR
jgi:hypothetical protein